MNTPTDPASGRVTISDVARVAGVSVATVSKVVNGRYGISAATVERVMAVVDKLGYQSSLVASSLRRQRTGVIGMLVAEFDAYAAELLKGIAGGLDGHELELLAYSRTTGAAIAAGWERRSLSRLGRTLIDGAIIVAPSNVIADTTGIPLVAVDPHRGPDGPPTVDADHLLGARTAVEHLLALGHRRIGFVRDGDDRRSARLREEGFRAALAEAGIGADPTLAPEPGDRAGRTERIARTLLSGAAAERPTAVFAANDTAAITVIRIATELGMRVPQELSVVGFDNVPDAYESAPPLTTVAQPLRTIGAEALRMLLDQLAGREVDRHLRLPTELIVRNSTAPPP